MTLYEHLVAAGCEIDSHYSDLYVKATPHALAIIEQFGGKPPHGRTSFLHQVAGERWIDIPFAYKPFWDDVQRRTGSRLPDDRSPRGEAAGQPKGAS